MFIGFNRGIGQYSASRTSNDGFRVDQLRRLHSGWDWAPDWARDHLVPGQLSRHERLSRVLDVGRWLQLGREYGASQLQARSPELKGRGVASASDLFSRWSLSPLRECSVNRINGR